MSITGTSISNVLFNFYNATSVSLSSIGFEGSILAPDATFIGKSGSTDGNVIVNAINDSSSFSFGDTAVFNGNPSIAAVPEPPTIVMTALGTIGILIVAFKTRKHKPPIVPAAV